MIQVESVISSPASVAAKNAMLLDVDFHNILGSSTKIRIKKKSYVNYDILDSWQSS